MTSLSPGQRKAAALLLLAVALWLLFSLLISPFWARYQEAADRVESLQHQLSVYQRVAAQLPSHQARLDELNRDNPIQPLLMAESRPALAGAQLQQRLNQVVERIGGQMISTQIIKNRDPSELQEIAIKAHMRGNTHHLVQLLHKLAYDTPTLTVENLVVVANQRISRARSRSRARRGNRPTAAPQSGILDIRFDLIGYTAREI
ncbi:type II secretion system protein GspM [Marinobacterium arenosum]|uniref:type II secretion system protein GspM n=1 Tax=Marinobacterium arenosum TaxID=2862496 RepID=UPI001C94BC11|nr:type II secretion system protein GspM [Marinobacterium arenosum]MBY4678556.1 type II secretion system protein M [Marinobacterium arenosum]